MAKFEERIFGIGGARPAVSVRLRGTDAPAELFSDAALTTPLANPLPLASAPHQPGVDKLGFVGFYAEAGDLYDFNVDGIGTWALSGYGEGGPDVILVSDDDTRFRLVVSDLGVLTTEEVV